MTKLFPKGVHIMYQNYIFDLYGTLVDIRTNEEKISLWKSMAKFMSLQGAVYRATELKKNYHETIDTIRCLTASRDTDVSDADSSKGKNNLSEYEVDFQEVIRRLYTKKGYSPSSAELKNWALMFRSLSLEHLCLYPGAKELLLSLRANNYKIYLLSNAQRLFTEPEMRYLGIYDLFDDVLYSSDIGFVKPSSHFYQALIEKHNLSTSNSVMIGNDWQADAWGAHKKGLDSMYIHTAQSPEMTGPLPPNCKQLESISQVFPATK